MACENASLHVVCICTCMFEVRVVYTHAHKLSLSLSYAQVVVVVASFTASLVCRSLFYPSLQLSMEEPAQKKACLRGNNGAAECVSERMHRLCVRAQIGQVLQSTSPIRNADYFHRRTMVNQARARYKKDRTSRKAGAAEHVSQADGETERVCVKMRTLSGRVLYTEHLALSDKKILREFIVRAAYIEGVQVLQVQVLIGQEQFDATSAKDPLLEMSGVKTLLDAHEDGNDAEIGITVIITTVLLAPEALPELRERALRSALGMRQLEEEACTWIKAQKSDVDLTSEWPNWKLYIARHKQSKKIVGPGILSFTTKFFPHSFFNPGGPNPELGCHINKANGGEVRIQPGVPELGFHINKSNGGEVRIQPGIHGYRALFSLMTAYL